MPVKPRSHSIPHGFVLKLHLVSSVIDFASIGVRQMPLIIVFALVGGAAQFVDGSLGMGFGVTSATLLTLLGYSAVAASAGTRGQDGHHFRLRSRPLA